MLFSEMQRAVYLDPLHTTKSVSHSIYGEKQGRQQVIPETDDDSYGSILA